MTVPYTEFQHHYPPRTANKVPYNSSVYKMWKRLPDAIGQFKMDGTNTQVVVHPDRHIELFTRHKLLHTEKLDPVSNFTLPDVLQARILDFTPKDTFTVYNAELLHHKTKMVKNTLYFFDVLVWDGQHMLGVPYGERHKIIWEILDGKRLPLHENMIDGQLAVAHNILVKDWDTAWEDAKKSQYCEGLVLKRFGSTSGLQLGLSEKNNGSFMVKVRKPKKNYVS